MAFNFIVPNLAEADFEVVLQGVAQNHPLHIHHVHPPMHLHNFFFPLVGGGPPLNTPVLESPEYVLKARYAESKGIHIYPTNQCLKITPQLMQQLSSAEDHDHSSNNSQPYNAKLFMIDRATNTVIDEIKSDDGNDADDGDSVDTQPIIEFTLRSSPILRSNPQLSIDSINGIIEGVATKPHSISTINVIINSSKPDIIQSNNGSIRIQLGFTEFAELIPIYKQAQYWLSNPLRTDCERMQYSLFCTRLMSYYRRPYIADPIMQSIIQKFCGRQLSPNIIPSHFIFAINGKDISDKSLNKSCDMPRARRGYKQIPIVQFYEPLQAPLLPDGIEMKSGRYNRKKIGLLSGIFIRRHNYCQKERLVTKDNIDNVEIDPNKLECQCDTHCYDTNGECIQMLHRAIDSNSRNRFCVYNLLLIPSTAPLYSGLIEELNILRPLINDKTKLYRNSQNIAQISNVFYKLLFSENVSTIYHFILPFLQRLFGIYFTNNAAKLRSKVALKMLHRMKQLNTKPDTCFLLYDSNYKPLESEAVLPFFALLIRYDPTFSLREYLRKVDIYISELVWLMGANSRDGSNSPIHTMVTKYINHKCIANMDNLNAIIDFYGESGVSFFYPTVEVILQSFVPKVNRKRQQTCLQFLSYEYLEKRKALYRQQLLKLNYHISHDVIDTVLLPYLF